MHEYKEEIKTGLSELVESYSQNNEIIKEIIELPICPNCGKSRDTKVHGVAKGRVIRYFDTYGEPDGDFTEYVWFDLSNIIRCVECGKIRKDLKFDHNKGNLIIK